MLDRSSISMYIYPMNTLPTNKKVQIVKLLVEGNSIRSTSRIAEVSKDTVVKLLVEIGKACAKFHDETVRGVNSQKVQADEIWSFCYSKEKNKPQDVEGAGDVWTWTAIDADSKLVVSWYVGEREPQDAQTFMLDLASRVKNRIQLTTDGFKPYLDAVYNAFDINVDYSQLIKEYGVAEGTSNQERKYSPNVCTGCKTKWVSGDPDPIHISTSFVERQNLTMRMSMRRFTRLTNAFSKKIENHCHAIALHFVYYNFAKVHGTLRVTPAMQAGLTKKPMSVEEIVKLIPEAAPKKRGPYKKKVASE